MTLLQILQPPSYISAFEIHTARERERERERAKPTKMQPKLKKEKKV
jgi:hypothetical protein